MQSLKDNILSSPPFKNYVFISEIFTGYSVCASNSEQDRQSPSFWNLPSGKEEIVKNNKISGGKIAMKEKKNRARGLRETKTILGRVGKAFSRW